MPKVNNISRLEFGDRISQAGKILPASVLQDHPGARIFLLADAAVSPLAESLAESLEASLAESMCVITHLVEGGEKVKSLSSIEEITSWLVGHKAGREDFLLILGGGSVCDAGAFVASIYKRGMPFALIPTTLLAQVDAAIGGKNAINFGGIKNVLGTFNMPEFTFICPEPLKTLPREEFRSGSAELIKTLLISGRNYKELIALLSSYNKEGAPDSQVPNATALNALAPFIAQAAKTKAAIVERDFYDRGERRVLNLGHTFGHALEAISNLSHGDAVAIGIILAARLACRKGLAPATFAAELKEDFPPAGLPTECPVPIETLRDLMRQDKKASAQKIKFILPIGIGQTTEVELSADDAITCLL